MTKFSEAVHAIVRKIPRGTVLSYGEVAKKAGYPQAARAVGNLLSKNFDPKIPCHRVINSGGIIGNYNRGQKTKIAKLQNEGLKIRQGKVKINHQN